jgi:hypothetical protein
MSRKSRLLRIFLVVGFVVAFAGYFAFSTFFFNPFEGRLGVDVSGLAPREVDFFVARADLGKLFGEFPRLAVEEDLKQVEAYQTWSAAPESAEFYESIGLSSAMRELEAIGEQMPLGMAPLDVIGGRDLALAGRFEGPELAQAEWAAYATLNWMGKLAVEGLAFPSLNNMEAQGFTVESGDDFVSVSGGGLSRQLFITRIKDVAVIATSKQWLDAAFDNQARQYEDSFLQRAIYADHIGNAKRGRAANEVEIFVNTRAAFEQLGKGGKWPDANSQDPVARFCSNYFRSGMLNRVIGMVSFDGGLNVDLHGELSSELMTSMQTQNYRIGGADSGELRDRILPYVPEDTALLIYGKSRAGDLLSTTFEVMEPAARDLVADALKQSGKYPTLQTLIDEVDASLKNRFAVIVRVNDYPKGENDPPNDGQPVFAIALLTWMDQPAKIEELRNTIGHMGSRIGLQPIRPQDSSGFYKNRIGGYTQYEYTSPAIPGTGVVVTQSTPDGICIVSNSVYMLNHLLKTSTQGAPTHPRLTDRIDFIALLDDSLPKAQLTVFADPRKAAGTFRAMSRRWAEDDITIDWRLERAKVEAQVLREQFPGQQQGSLSTAVQAEVDAIVDPKLDELKERIFAEQVPVLQQETLRKIAYSEAISASLLRINFDPKKVELSLRVVTPLE